MENNEKIKKVQETQMLILKVFVDICDHYNLRWYMIGGSLIGVLRHKGFIPWDDDIDIGMPREDYDKFVSLQNNFPIGFSLTDRYSDRNWPFLFSQFVDNESEIIVHMNEQPRKCKVWIDIFPIDGLPSNSFVRWIHVKKILACRYLIQIPNIRTQVDTHKVGRPLYEKLIIKMLHVLPIGFLINVNKTQNKLEKLLRTHSFDSSNWAGNMLGKYREKEVMRKEWWGNPVRLPFENMEVNCPSDSDKIETKLYGNYMKWPAEKNRVSHDIEIVKLRNSNVS